ncbi:MAG: leucine-rich repeat domain-containing protein [Bacteroidaceae bacterium]|nr:leucine-rich repeat domain-containing protein [Bacteroidaceae bacterium]
MKFKFKSMLLVLMAMLCSTPLFAHDFEVNGIYYNVTSADDLTVAVTYKGSASSEYSNEYSDRVTIPESVTYGGNTYRVTSIGDYAFRSCTRLYAVTIPNSVTSIGLDAFYNCDFLYSITIPNSVTSIGSSAFAGCSRLSSIAIPNSVTSIGVWAFAECTGLSSITLPNSLTSIENATFQYCTSLTDITIPNSVTSIKRGAFQGCSGLTSINIPNSVTSIENGAFYGCSDLTSITIPNSVTSIEYSAFSGTAWYENQPQGIVYAGKVLYKYKGTMPANTSIEVKEGTVSISQRAFQACSGLSSITIVKGLNIEEEAFSDCTNLTSVTIGDGTTNIGYQAFYGCINLTSITIGDGDISIREKALDKTAWYDKQSDGVVYAGKALYKYKGTMPANTSIEIKGGTKSISPYAFYECSYLTSINIPNSVKSIGESAFSGCGFTSIVIPNSVTSIEDGAFSNCGCTSIVIPNSVKSIGESAFSGCFNLNSVTIKNGVTSIGRLAFYKCYNLTSINIPNSVKSIEYGAFQYCSNLTSVTIGDSVTNIGSETFSGCSSLAEVISYIPADKLFSIDYNTFDGLPSNSVLTVPIGAKETYKTTDGWKRFNNIVEMGEESEIRDVVLTETIDYENGEIFQANSVTYSRTLPNLMWNALYLPVEIPVSALSENYDVAYFNNMHAYDRDDDGTIDEMAMEVIRVAKGTLHANHPYFIRAKNEAAKNMNLELTDVTVYNTDASYCTSLTTSSVYMNFELTGVYKRHEGSDLQNCYAITAKGAWSPIAANSYLNPFRFYLKVTNRNGTPVKADEALQTIHIYLKGEQGTTDIDETIVSGQESTIIYDLQGRRIVNPKKGMYIMNGKKVLIK